MEKKTRQTAFARRLYALVRLIPAGKVATYGQLALLLGIPRGARAVGTCLSRCADPTVPCHRVVDRTGGTKAAFDDYGPGTQQALLEAEGVRFLPDGRADLSLCLWQPEI
jgi:methylated-DNA-protein-cysteine methyltransferase-like protein